MRPLSFIPADRIDPSREMPIYMQIARAIIHEVERGRLTPGSYLPSTRDAAQSLGVNRKTMVLAYEELVAQGWLVSHGTRGTAVSPSLPGPVAQTGDSMPRAGDATPRAEYPFLPPSGPPIAIPVGDWIKLDEGSPDGRQFPPDLLIRAYRSAIRSASEENRLQYRDPRGSPLLRESIAAMLKSQRGLMVTADNICVTRGSQMGISLAARVLIRPGDTVLVEALTYEPAVGAFRACGANIVTIGLDRSGADIDAIERACRRHRVRAIFLTPHHQFPTTVSLPPESRLRVLDLARQFGFAVLEDDYDHEFQFGARPLLPMASYAPGQVIYVGSLSKLLLPALRVGYIVAPPDVIDSIAYQVSLTDGMGNTLTEDAAADLILSGDVRRHTRKVTRVYGARRDAFAQALATTMGDIVEYAIPDGGLAFWLRFRNTGDLDRLEENAEAHGLRFASSRSFMADPSAPRGLRIGFASLTEDEAVESLRRMRSAIGR